MKTGLFLSFGLAVVGVACGGLTMRGAESVKPGREPVGKKLVEYRPAECKDASGTPANRNTSIYLVEDVAGRRLMVELTPGYDSLVVKNAFLDRGEVAFQAVLKSKTGRMMLHDFRFPNDFGSAGRMAVAQSWREVGLEGGGFRGYFDQPLMTCALALAGAEGATPATPTATATASAPPTATASAPPAGTAPAGIGTPEPRDRYAVGDIVAVDVQGQPVRAKVVQAVEGDRYYVEYQTSPPSSEWVDKSRIRGKL
jgi:hypothetical protein